MEGQKIIEYIVHGMEYYTETLAVPAHMEHYDDGMCAWIKPKNSKAGPACVYKVNFGDKSDEETRKLVQSYLKNGAPNVWFVTPLSTPNNVKNILSDLGLMDPTNEDLNDDGMAIPPDQMRELIWKNEDDKSTLSVKRVDNKESFKIWCDITNEVLHGFKMLDFQLYYPLCESSKMVCFLGYDGEKPVASSAIMNNNGSGTLEFIATLPNYRKKGLGRAVCCAAINQLIKDKAFIISLRGRSMGVSLYTKLVFKSYFRF
jgi:ribosomal protein S18 acetylase RimI-like enzyme